MIPSIDTHQYKINDFKKYRDSVQAKTGLDPNLSPVVDSLSLVLEYFPHIKNHQKKGGSNDIWKVVRVVAVLFVKLPVFHNLLPHPIADPSNHTNIANHEKMSNHMRYQTNQENIKKNQDMDKSTNHMLGESAQCISSKQLLLGQYILLFIFILQHPNRHLSMQ